MEPAGAILDSRRFMAPAVRVYASTMGCQVIGMHPWPFVVTRTGHVIQQPLEAARQKLSAKGSALCSGKSDAQAQAIRTDRPLARKYRSDTSTSTISFRFTSALTRRQVIVSTVLAQSG